MSVSEPTLFVSNFNQELGLADASTVDDTKEGISFLALMRAEHVATCLLQRYDELYGVSGSWVNNVMEEFIGMEASYATASRLRFDLDGSK